MRGNLFGLIVVVLLVASSGAAGALSGSAPSFARVSSYSIGGSPDSVAIGDLNGDGKPDVVTANYGARSVSVLMNRGDGKLGTKIAVRTTRKPFAVAIGDLNSDGKQDLVTANAAAHSISVLVNLGDGSFRADVEYQAGRVPVAIALGDLDGDGSVDIATANGSYKGNTVTVLLNDGDGTFRAKQDYGAGPVPISVVIGDLNGDGRRDLAVANSYSNTVSVLLNDGDGSFATKVDYRASNTADAQAVAIGDVDADGKPDLVTANALPDCIADAPTSDVCPNTVSVLLNRGRGNWSRHDYKTGPWPISVVIGDLNGDGMPDLATASREFLVNTVSVLANKGGGSFWARLDYRAGGGPLSLAIGDLNGDGKPDLATANVGRTVSVLLNRPGLCTVQNVLDRTLPTAKRWLTRANCRIGKVRRAYSSSRKGLIRSQKPRFGAVLPGGSKVNLVVSLGKKRS
jgi:hypothetical protein